MSLPTSTSLGISILALSAPAQIQWQQFATNLTPPTRAAGDFDSARGQFVIFGGDSGPIDTTWEWDGFNWNLRQPATVPPARLGTTIVYDAARGETIMFGGGQALLGGPFLDDTWRWDGTDWTQLFPAHAPSARGACAGYFDPIRDVVVIHGGFLSGFATSDEMWEWDGTDWTQQTVSPRPSARAVHQLVWDEHHGVAVTHGGCLQIGVSMTDTWTWDGSAWTQHAVGRSPGARCDYAIAYDAARRRTVLFGGTFVDQATGLFLDIGDHWEWDGSAWTMRTPIGAAPSARSAAYMFYDSTTRIVFLGGGRTVAGVGQTDSWTLTPVEPATATAYGVGCATTTGVPTLTAESLPWFGVVLELRVGGLPASVASAFLVFGVSDSMFGPVALPFDLGLVGAPRCELSTSIEATLQLPIVAGEGVVGVALCACPSLLAQPWHVQAIVPDLGLAQPLKIGVSEGLRLGIGGR